MSKFRAEVQTPGLIAANLAAGAIPLALRLLIGATTSRWSPPPGLHPAVSEWAARMEADGWLLRGAWQRNYMLWRNGRTMREGRLPLLVLPLGRARLTGLQLDVFLAVEMAEARKRHAAARLGSSTGAHAELRSLLQAIAKDAAVEIVDAPRLHREALHQLEANPEL